MNEFVEEFKLAILIRKTEEKLLELFKNGKINGTVHTCIGQEFTGVAVSKYLLPDDYVLSNHRGHGHYLSRTDDLTGLLSELMGRKTGCSGGIGGSQHLFNYNYFSNGIQGGMAPIANGLGLSIKLNNKKNIVVIFIGDGTLGEGIIYESLNIASIWAIPVLFILENNEMAQSTSTKQTMSGTIQGRAEAFGIHYDHCSTNELDILFGTAEKTINYVRDNVKPALLEIRTNRLYSHSKGDDNRDPELIKELQNKDPLNTFSIEHKELYDQINKTVQERIESALKEAFVSELLDDYSQKEIHFDKEVKYTNLIESVNKRGNELLNEAFETAFSEDARLIMIGEDIETSNEYNPGEYGGAFKVSRNLSLNFKDRIRNTPISEAAIVGVGTGLAMAGFRPIVEIMFGDFITLILDQLLQHACKFRLMYTNKINVPLIVRTPMGGRRGYGPTHSQSLEKHFLGITDLDVLALNHRINPQNIYKTLISSISNPTLVIENKTTYTKKLNTTPIQGYDFYQSDEIFPTLKISTSLNEPDCTIICYGGILEEVENTLKMLFENEEIVCEVICPSKINPININPIATSVKKSKKLLIVEEGPNIAAWGSEVIAMLAERGIHPDKIKRIANNTIIPCSLHAENKLIPGSEKIYNAIKTLVLS